MGKVYNVLKAHPDHIASMLSGQMPSGADLLRIAEYLNYSVDALVPESVSVGNVKIEDSLLSHIPPKDMILNIMTKLAASEEYNYLQVSISRIVISNLARKNIQKSKLESLMLSKKNWTSFSIMMLLPTRQQGLTFPTWLEFPKLLTSAMILCSPVKQVTMTTAPLHFGFNAVGLFLYIGITAIGGEAAGITCARHK